MLCACTCAEEINKEIKIVDFYRNNRGKVHSCLPYKSSNKNGIALVGFAWLACLLPMLVLLAEFILAMEASLVLLANFAGPVITQVS
jgi:hypothetical protein